MVCERPGAIDSKSPHQGSDSMELFTPTHVIGFTLFDISTDQDLDRMRTIYHRKRHVLTISCCHLGRRRCADDNHRESDSHYLDLLKKEIIERMGSTCSDEIKEEVLELTTSDVAYEELWPDRYVMNVMIAVPV
jgi:hypothetical protein